MSARPRITDEQRRARLLHRHRLSAARRGLSPVDVADAVVGLHATTPSTVYLSMWARLDDFTPARLDVELYEKRTLVRQLAMRRTMFVVSRPVLAEAIGAVGPRVAASERTNMLRDLRRSPDFPDPEGWIDAARSAVITDLADGAMRSSAELRQRLPELEGHVEMYPDKSWGGRNPMGPRVLNMMSAAGDIVRGPNVAGWHLSRPQWALMSSWLGDDLMPVSVEDGHRAMVRRWLRAFGPGTETDLVWWLGCTKSAVRAALGALDVVEVTLDRGETGYVLPDDLEPDEPPSATVFLLPELDPTTMGWKERSFYLGEHAEHLFDRNGNGGADCMGRRPHRRRLAAEPRRRIDQRPPDGKAVQTGEPGTRRRGAASRGVARRRSPFTGLSGAVHAVLNTSGDRAFATM